MPKQADLGDLEIPGNTELPALLAACPGAEVLRFHDQEYLIQAEDPGEHGARAGDVFLVLRGSCLVEHPGAPQQRKPGSELAVIEGTPDRPVFAGEMAYLGGGYRTASVRSAMNTWAVRLKPQHLDTIIERFPSFTRILCGQFCKRLREANELLKRHQANTAMAFDQVSLAPGDILFRAGDPAERLHQWIEGVLVFEAGGARETIPGDPGAPGPAPLFIEARPYFLDGVHQGTVRAKSQAIVLAIHKASKQAVVRNFPDLVLDLLAP